MISVNVKGSMPSAAEVVLSIAGEASAADGIELS